MHIQFLWIVFKGTFVFCWVVSKLFSRNLFFFSKLFSRKSHKIIKYASNICLFLIDLFYISIIINSILFFCSSRKTTFYQNLLFVSICVVVVVFVVVSFYIPGVYVVCSVVFNDVCSVAAATGAPVKGLTPVAGGGGMANTGC